MVSPAASSLGASVAAGRHCRRWAIENALGSVGLANESKKRIGAYSRGMRQRLGIAELLIKDSRVAFFGPLVGLILGFDTMKAP